MYQISSNMPVLEIPQENLFDKIKNLWRVGASQSLFAKTSFITMILILVITPIIITEQTNTSSHAAPTTASITVDPTIITGRVNPLVFGQDMYYPNGTEPYYSDATNKTLDTSFLQLVNKLSPTLIRCGGGLDSEWYHWTDGIGPISSRSAAQMKRSASSMVNTFGTDECLQYAEKLGAKVAITVDDNDYPVTNLNPWNPQATPKEAAAWVAYVNGNPSNTSTIGVDEYGKDWKTVGYWAQKRAQNGHAAPYNIVYWEIGNEDYSFSGLSGTSYANRFILFAKAMKHVDGNIKLGAVMHNDQPLSDWNKQVILTAAKSIDYLIYHDYLIESVSMERLFGHAAITKTITLPSPMNGVYTFTFRALTAYTASGNSKLQVQLDGKTVFDGDVTRNHDNFNIISFSLPSSQVSSTKNHTLILNFYNIQNSVDVIRTYSINNTQYDLFTEQELYEKRLATTQNILQHITQLRELASKSGLDKKIPLYVSEYDTLDSYATKTASYTSSIMTASMIATYIQNSIDLASFWLLNDWRWWSATAPHGEVSKPHYENAQFYALELLRDHTSHELVQTQVSSPTLGNGMPLLQAFASIDKTTKPNSKMHLLVINKSYNQDITTQISYKNAVPFANPQVTTLNASSVSSTRTSATDHSISLTASQASGYLVNYTFPAHSVTAIDFELQHNDIPTPSLTPTPTPMYQTIFGPTSQTIVKNATHILAGDSSTKDIKISFSFTPSWTDTTHDQHTGLYFHRQNLNWGQIFFRPTGIFYTTHTDAGYGHEQKIAAVTISNVSTHTASITVRNNAVLVTFDGKEYGPINLSLPSSGSIDFYSYWLKQVKFSNILVQKIVYP